MTNPRDINWRSLAKTAMVVVGLGSILMTLGAVHEAYTNQGKRVERTDERVHEHDKALAVMSEKIGHAPPSADPIVRTAQPAPSASHERRTRPSSAASIAEPLDGHSSPIDAIRVSGKVEPGLGDPLFLLVCPDLAVQCWPQSPNDKEGLPVVREGEQWRVIANLGGPPQSYRLVLYAAKPDAASALSTYLRKAAASGSHPGLMPQDFPAGMTELDRITISKR